MTKISNDPVVQNMLDRLHAAVSAQARNAQIDAARNTIQNVAGVAASAFGLGSAFSNHSHELYANQLDGHLHNNRPARAPDYLRRAQQMSREELLREMAVLYAEAATAKGAYQQLRQQFHTIFNVDASTLRMSTESPPERPGHLRIRVRVPAREYVCTADEYVIAQRLSGQAANWAGLLANQAGLMQIVIQIIKEHIVEDQASTITEVMSAEPDWVGARTPTYVVEDEAPQFEPTRKRGGTL